MRIMAFFRMLFATGMLIPAFFLMIQTAGAATPFYVYSTLTSANTFNPTAGSTIGGSDRQAIANRFVPSSDGVLHSIELGLRTVGTSQSVEVQLLLDNGSGMPGTLLLDTTATVSTLFGGSDATTMTSVTSSGAVSLSTSQTYWVAVLPISANILVWDDSLASLGSGASRKATTPWNQTFPDPHVQEAFRVLAVVPEPSSWALFGLAVGGLVFAMARRRITLYVPRHEIARNTRAVGSSRFSFGFHSLR